MSARRLLPLVLAALLPAACGEAPMVQSPTMQVSAASLAFTAPDDGSDPPAQVVTIANGGGGALAAPLIGVSYASGQGWLEVAPSGSAAPYTLTVRPTVGALPVGSYAATVTLATVSASNSPQRLAVTLTVNGTRIRRLLTSWAEDGTRADAPDLALVGIDLLQDDGAGGTLRTAAVATAEAGTWTARPRQGAYWAQLTWADGHLGYVHAATADLDLGADLGGRPRRVAAAPQTLVTLDLSGLLPWAVGDSLRATSWGAQARAHFQPAFGLGDETVSYPFDWATTLGTLLAADDVVHVTQHNFGFNEPLNDFSYDEVTSATALTGATLADGAAVTLAAPPFSSPALVMARVDWRRAEFEAAAAPFSPATAGQAHRLGLYAIPAPLTAPSPLGAVALPVIESTSLAGEPDVEASGVSFARWLPAAWREYVEATFDAPAEVFAPGATAPLALARSRVRRVEAMSGTVIAAAPLLGVVTAPRIDTLDALTTQTGRTTTPVLSWTAPATPATGVPTSYRLALYELSIDGGGTTQGRLVADFVLTDTSLAMPSGILQPGKAYAARLAALSSPGDAGGASPFRVGVPLGEAVRWTAAFSTAP